MTSEKHQAAFRLEVALVERMKAYAARRTAEARMPVSLTRAATELIELGLSVVEKQSQRRKR